MIGAINEFIPIFNFWQFTNIIFKPVKTGERMRVFFTHG
jgi:hypothetical protein